MKLVHNISIKYKLMLIILSITLFITGIGSWVGMYHYEKNLRNDLIKNMEVNAKLIGEYCVSPLAFNDAPGAERVLSKLQAIPPIIHGRVYDENHQVFAIYNKLDIPIESPFPTDMKDSKYLFEKHYIHVVQPIEYEGYYYGHINLAGTLAPLYEKIKDAQFFMILLVVMLVVLSTVLAFVLQRLISQPILKLAQVTELISTDADLSFRVKKKGSDELGILYDGFNTMLEQLHQKEQERDRAEDEIKATLREKEVMLREIHHRVKNNLQIISSLLSLQSSQIQDDKTLGMFVDCQNRVRSMALVHEKLYQAPDLASIHFADYVEALVMALQTTYRADFRVIKFDIDIMDVSLAIDKAVPCGLLIHELVSNSLKHAFNSHAEGMIQIRLRKDEERDLLCLYVRDNGRGIPEDLDYKNTDSLGLRLAVVLAEKQLRGSIDLDRSAGTAFSIVF